VHIGLVPALLGVPLLLGGGKFVLGQMRALSGARRYRADRLRRLDQYRRGTERLEPRSTSAPSARLEQVSARAEARNDRRRIPQGALHRRRRGAADRASSCRSRKWVSSCRRLTAFKSPEVLLRIESQFGYAIARDRIKRHRPPRVFRTAGRASLSFLSFRKIARAGLARAAI
jgi:hypothetical protein